MVADEIRRILEKTAPGQAYVTVKRSLLQNILAQCEKPPAAVPEQAPAEQDEQTNGEM